MTELERCLEHSRLIKDVMIKQATETQAIVDMKENHNELKEAFWKVEGGLRKEMKENSEKTVKLQIKTAVIHSIMLVLFGVFNALAIKMLADYIGALR